MPYFWDLLTERGKNNLIWFMRVKLGIANWYPPLHTGKPIEVHTKLEPLDEIAKIMAEPPKVQLGKGRRE